MALFKSKYDRIYDDLYQKKNIPGLIKILKNDKNEDHRELAAHALGEIGNTEAIDVLQHVIKHDLSFDVRKSAKNSLNKLLILDAPRKIMQYKENNDEENLLDVLSLNDDDLKLKTIHALSIMGQERSLDKLLSLIDDRIDITIGIALLLAIRKIAARIDRTISNQHFESFENAIVHKAIMENRIHEVRQMMQCKINLDVANEYGTRPIFYALNNNSLDMISLLLEAKADIHSNDLGGTPLLFRCKKDPSGLKILKLLVDHGADIHTKDKNGNSLLHDSARWRDIEMIKFLISNNMDINTLNNNHQTALHVAISFGNMKKYDVVETLLDAGIDCNITTDQGKTAAQLIEQKLEKIEVERWELQIWSDKHLIDEIDDLNAIQKLLSLRR